MKEIYKLFEDEKSKFIGKFFLKSVGFTDFYFRKNLKFSRYFLERAERKVLFVKVVFFGMWKKVFDMVRFRYFGRTDSFLFLKVKLLMKKFGLSCLLSRDKLELVYRSRKDIDLSILEIIVEVLVISLDFGNLIYVKRYYDVKYFVLIMNLLK